MISLLLTLALGMGMPDKADAGPRNLVPVATAERAATHCPSGASFIVGWDRAPPYTGALKDFPPAARARGIDGFAVLDCLNHNGVNTHCTVAWESPLGSGFGQASLRAAAAIKLPESYVRPGQSDERVCLPLRWDTRGVSVLPPPPIMVMAPPPAARRAYVAPPVVHQGPFPSIPSRPAIITRPDWIRKPDGDDLERYYPPAAMEAGIEGHAIIDCIVTAEGTLTACAVSQEGPPGAGFGAATLRVASHFAMRPMTVDGQPVSGARVRLPVSWRVAESPPTPPNTEKAAPQQRFQRGHGT